MALGELYKSNKWENNSNHLKSICVYDMSTVYIVVFNGEPSVSCTNQHVYSLQQTFCLLSKRLCKHIKRLKYKSMTKETTVESFLYKPQ